MLWYFSPTGTGRWVAKGLERAFPGLETADLTQPAARGQGRRRSLPGSCSHCSFRCMDTVCQDRCGAGWSGCRRP